MMCLHPRKTPSTSIENSWRKASSVRSSIDPCVVIPALLTRMSIRSQLASAASHCASFDTSSSTRSEVHTSELQSLMRISYAVFCLKKEKKKSIKILHINESLFESQFQQTTKNK